MDLESVIDVKFPLWLHHKYYTTRYGELGVSQLTQLKDGYSTYLLSFLALSFLAAF